MTDSVIVSENYVLFSRSFGEIDPFLYERMWVVFRLATILVKWKINSKLSYEVSD
jgi:hypothetical protein